ncbi:hypothetical protein [Nocardia crassostreae]|uniref:hypothetical protein n=1 Tax=Nocardia crassostreae TaxID=53428 RepID=UPI000A005986|nr:hypothetical protein [Nocardia crassostreae]
MEREQFAEAVLGSLRARGVTDGEYDAEEFEVRHSGGEVMYLGNVFRELAGESVEEMQERIDNFVAAVTSTDEPPEDWESARPLLRAVLRPVTHGMGTFGPGAERFVRPAFPFVDEAVVVDLPRTRSYVTPEMVRDWGGHGRGGVRRGAGESRGHGAARLAGGVAVHPVRRHR